MQHGAQTSDERAGLDAVLTGDKAKRKGLMCKCICAAEPRHRMLVVAVCGPQSDC